MSVSSNWILDEEEYLARQKNGDFPHDLSYEEFVEIRKEQQRRVAEVRAAMHPLDREVLERHEARRRREAERRAA